MNKAERAHQWAKELKAITDDAALHVRANEIIDQMLAEEYSDIEITRTMTTFLRLYGIPLQPKFLPSFHLIHPKVDEVMYSGGIEIISTGEILYPKSGKEAGEMAGKGVMYRPLYNPETMGEYPLPEETK